ncbi:hypothetical protein CYMTET_9546 [Cymbomonas tetramitiformis]|uniref:Uncharacterized protein n=1 Tax=Cymbomonas tetramitiformis TaxID=36881 RepID=A0AAE0GRJ4_9CHLO|nr:hypothetical protein CYMTET_9546 [Cymbomonas tetramitiformis]
MQVEQTENLEVSEVGKAAHRLCTIGLTRPGDSWTRRAAHRQQHDRKWLFVGAQLEMYWPLDNNWYKDTVTDVAGTGQHYI